MNKPILLAASALAALLAAPQAALSQPYPVRPVRVLIPFPPGGPNDIVGRIVFHNVSAALRQQFVLENRPGASGTIGADIAAKSAPDGYTLLVHSATHLSNAHLYKRLPYDTLKDFMGLTPLAVQVAALVVHPSLPVKSVAELIALAKARPGEIVYASSSNGTFSHLSMALFSHLTETKMIHVPYKGAGPATTAIASGETQVMIANIGALLPQIRARRVRPLAVTADKRVRQFPDLPTLSEAGVPGFELSSWVACFLPAGTPASIVDKLSAQIKHALDNPDVVRTLSNQTLDPWFLTPEEFQKRLNLDYRKYGSLIRLTGARAE
jgi:tripartite-type tricarboxylate transporter receptor subunit TctC